MRNAESASASTRCSLWGRSLGGPDFNQGVCDGHRIELDLTKSWGGNLHETV